MTATLPLPPFAAPPAGDVILTTKGVDVSYGSVQVLFGVDLEVQRGEIVALLGTNGAGKSTILKAICGLVKPTAGTVHFNGKDITGTPADKTAALGIAQMPGGKGVFPTLSVSENLRLAAWLMRKDRKRAAEARDEVLDLFPRLRERAGQMAGNLSGGEQQMLSLGQVFMNRPQVLMIDELSLGLAPAIVGQLIEVVQTIHSTGTTIMIVEQSVNVALTLAQRAVFMEKGEVRFTGPTQDLLDRPDILRSVFISGAGADAGGEKESAVVKAKRASTSVIDKTKPVLECREVVKRFGGIRAVNGVDLVLHEGEILGLVGGNGAGKTTLFDLISGFQTPDEGRIVFRGVDVTDWQPFERANNRLGRSFQEAKLFPSLSVEETIAVSLERHLESRDIVAAAFRLPASYESEDAIVDRVRDLIDLMGLTAFREKLTGELSTGTRRIVELACILASDPKVVLLDEPSAGVAQKETEALGPLLLRVKEATGCSILIIEHDMPLLSGICDRMMCLELGAPIAEGTPAEVLSHPRVIESYLGTNDAAINRSGANPDKPAEAAAEPGDGAGLPPAPPTAPTAPTAPAPPRQRRAPLKAAGR